MIFGLPGQNAAFTGRATIAGTAVDAGFSAADIQSYDTSNSVDWTQAATINIDIDRGASPPTQGPTFLLLSNFRASDYNYIVNSTNLTSIDVYDGATTGAETNQLATQITDGSPAQGAGVFGQAQIFIDFDLLPVTQRHVRIKFTLGGSATVTIGNLFLGLGLDTSDEGWGHRTNWQMSRINRSRFTDLYDGGEAQNNRASIRTVRASVAATEKAYHWFMDAAEGRRSDYIDDVSRPWAICFDPTNVKRADTAQHYYAGLWRLRGNVTENITSGRSNGFVTSDIPLDFRELK